MKKKIYLLLVIILVFALLVPGSLSSAATNQLFDGGFEQYPDSSWWYHSEPIGGVFMNSTLNSRNFFDNLVMPAALCGTGIYNVGKTTYPLDFRNGSVPAYQFAWTGGTFYWQAGMLGPWFRSFFPITAYSYAEIYLLDTQGNRTTLLSDHQLAYGADWERNWGSVDLAAGSYVLYLGRGASMEKTDAWFYRYQLFYDDVYYGSEEPNHSACQDSFEATPTFEPTLHYPTVAPTWEGTPTNYVTPTTQVGWHFHTFSESNNGDSGITCPDSEYSGGFYLDGAGDASIVYNTNNNMYDIISFNGRLRYTYNAAVLSSSLNWGTVTTSSDKCATNGICLDNSPWFKAYQYEFGSPARGWPGAIACYGNISNTPTPTLSPTPGPSPTQSASIYNCGFEQGELGWYFTPPSYVALAGGQTGPQYAVAVHNPEGLPEIFQNIYWPASQIIYVQGWAKGQTQIRFWNIYGNTQQTLIYSGDDAEWTQFRTYFSLSAGYYRLELNTFDPPGSEGYFDGVTLSAGDFMSDFVCSMYTPTPGPTSYVTPTPGPSRTPSITPTPRTSRTAWGTRTPWPSGTPSLTPSPANGLTETALASITPGGGGSTATPGGGGSTITPGPGQFIAPEQPPGGEDAPCQRPQSLADQLNLGWWLDYEVCDVKRFLSWGPSANATAAAIPTLFAGKEPFHTIDSIQTGFRGMQTQVATFEWHDTGFNGVKGDAETVDPRPDKILNYLSAGVPEDPWAIGGTISFKKGVNPDFFSKICSTQLTDILSGRLSEGLCAVLNVTRRIGYLGWVQFMLNVVCIFAIIKNFLSIINFYGKFSVPSGGSSEIIANIVSDEVKK